MPIHSTSLKLNQGDSIQKFLALLQTWEKQGYEGEPDGWMRHPATGRRRPNGNAISGRCTNQIPRARYLG